MYRFLCSEQHCTKFQSDKTMITRIVGPTKNKELLHECHKIIKEKADLNTKEEGGYSEIGENWSLDCYSF